MREIGEVPLLSAAMCCAVQAGPLSDLLTPEHSLALCRVLEYSRYVQGLKVQEGEPGCEQCTSNRLLLEKLWQVRCCLVALQQVLIVRINEINSSPQSLTEFACCR